MATVRSGRQIAATLDVFGVERSPADLDAISEISTGTRDDDAPPVFGNVEG